MSTDVTPGGAPEAARGMTPGATPSVSPRSERRFLAVLYANSALPYGLVQDVTLFSAALALMGASPVVIGAAGIVMQISVACFLTAPLLLGVFRSRSRMIVVSSAVAFLGFAGMASSLFMPRGEPAIIAMLAFMLLSQVGSSYRTLPWTDLIRRELPPEHRIRMVTGSIVVSLLVATAASYGVKLAIESDLGFPRSYAVVFAAAAAAAGVALLTVLALRKDRLPAASAGAPHFFRVALHEVRNLPRTPVVPVLLGYGVLLLLCSNAAGLYVASGYRRAPEEMAHLFGQALVIRTFVKAVAYFVAGRIAARVGNRPILVAVCAAGAMAPIASLFLPFHFYTLVLIATNLMPMFEPFLVNILMNVSTDEEFPARFTLYSIIGFPLSLLLPILGLLVTASWPAFDVLILTALAGAAFLVLRMPARAEKGRAQAGQEQ